MCVVSRDPARIFKGGPIVWFGQGSWRNGKRHGQGRLVYESGNVYVGAWIDDRKCGKGRMDWTSRNERFEVRRVQPSPHLPILLSRHSVF